MAIAEPPFPVARFSVEQYHRMIESGAFGEDDRLELVDGWVVRKIAIGPGHEFSTGQLGALLQELLPPDMHLRIQAPLTLEDSEPEPDLAIVRGSRGDYRDHHPDASDVALVVEVSDTSLTTDRLKGRTYARAGIPEYWIVNLVDRRVGVYRHAAGSTRSTPQAESYTHCDTFSVDQSAPVSVARDAGTQISVREILP